MKKVEIIDAGSHQHHQKVADASCFYFSFAELMGLSQEFSANAKELVALPGRIEVSDKVGPLHYHNGVTIVFITAGYGCIKTEILESPVRTGDIVIVPAKTKHLSVAAPGTTMIEHIVFIGTKGDLQAVQ